VEQDDVVIVEEIPASNRVAAENVGEFYIIRGIDDPLSNLYEFTFTHDGKDYRSVEHSYQFLGVKDHDPVEANNILNDPSPFSAMRRGKRVKRRYGVKHSEADLELMTALVKAKASQCRAFRMAIRSAMKKGLSFVHSTYPADDFYGSGLHYKAKHIPAKLPGANHLGKIISDIAANLEPEECYESQTSFAMCSGMAVILYDGEKLPFAARQSKPSSGRQGKPVQTSRTLSYGNGRTDSTHHGHRCFHCGVPGHTKSICRLIDVDVVCRLCHVRGHKQRYCTNVPLNHESAQCGFDGWQFPNVCMTSNVTPGYGDYTPYVSRQDYNHHFPPLPSSF
jgi:ribA/ribD-fused uncharacterized protein